MDLERLKQNFRIRSGRTKKNKKAPKQSVQTAQPTRSLPEQTQPSHIEQEDKNNADKAQAGKEEEKEAGRTPAKPDSGVGLSPEKSIAGDIPTEDEATGTDNKKDDDKNFQDEQTEDQDISETQHDPQNITAEGDKETANNTMAGPYDADTNESSEALNFDLSPPTRKRKTHSTEWLSEHLFSAGHLNMLLHQPSLLSRFTAFLQRYCPKEYPYLLRYIEASKAVAAIEYANAVAESVTPLPDETSRPQVAAVMDDTFHNLCSTAFEALHETCLPMYITYNLVKVVSECLVNEMAGRSTSIMSSYVGGLSEVFCLTDPNQEDNPIIYASEEFYRLTGYGRDDVIGHNCRFLQGSKTMQKSPVRLKGSIEKGEERCETLLNYRRDGRPFINMLMIAPLHDDKGNVKYFIGAQVDVSGLIQGGRVLEGFQRYLSKAEADQRRNEQEAEKNAKDTDSGRRARTLTKLRELSELFDLEESAVVHSHSRSSSLDRDDDSRSIASGKPKVQRKFLVDSDSDEENEDLQSKRWTLGEGGPNGLSGRLPGVYEKYMLIRPAPSLRIIFTSPKLRSFGKIAQSPFLSHVAAPRSTLAGLHESFTAGIPVSAKINFMPAHGEKRNGTELGPQSRHEDGKYGRACWISATPLLGSEDQIGVWMIVFAEKSQAQRMLNGKPELYQGSEQLADKGKEDPQDTRQTKIQTPEQQSAENADLPIRPKRIEPGQQDKPVPSKQIVAPPVEEYHSEEEVYEDVPHAVSVQDKGSSPASTTKSSSEGYVHTQSKHSISSSSNRVRIDPDSDTEHDEHQHSRMMANARSTPEREFSASPHYLPADKSPSETSEVDSRHSSPPSHENQRQGRSENTEENTILSDTTLRQTSRSISPDPFVEDDDTPRKQDKKLLVSAGLGYMDYIRHPGGSRHASGYQEVRGRTKWRENMNDDFVSDPDCGTSPYSVD